MFRFKLWKSLLKPTYQVIFNNDFRVGSIHVRFSYFRRYSTSSTIKPEKFSSVGMQNNGNWLSNSSFISVVAVQDQHSVFQFAFDANQTYFRGINISNVQIAANPIESNAIR